MSRSRATIRLSVLARSMICRISWRRISESSLVSLSISSNSWLMADTGCFSSTISPVSDRMRMLLSGRVGVLSFVKKAAMATMMSRIKRRLKIVFLTRERKRPAYRKMAKMELKRSFMGCGVSGGYILQKLSVNSIHCADGLQPSRCMNSAYSAVGLAGGGKGS